MADRKHPQARALKTAQSRTAAEKPSWLSPCSVQIKFSERAELAETHSLMKRFSGMGCTNNRAQHETHGDAAWARCSLRDASYLQTAYA